MPAAVHGDAAVVQVAGPVRRPLGNHKTREKADAAVAGRAGRQLDEGVPTMHQGHRGTCGQWIDQLIDMISTQKILARRARGLSKHVRVSFPPF
jgi:hypothetical protein